MRRVDLHPEDLFDHLRAGELRPEERERLDQHCEMCSACAFELELVDASRADATPTDLDHAIASRALERMWSTEQPPAPTRAKARSQGAYRAAALLLAGVLVGGSMSAAALTGSSPFVLVELVTAWVSPAEREQPSPSTQTPATQRKPRKVTAARVPVATPASIEEAVPPPTPVVEVAPIGKAVTAPTNVVTQVERTPSPAPPAVEPPPPATPDPATWFFRAASRARAAGRYHEAVALYGVLERDFAGSETEVVARVALGRLWLAQLNDATQALAAFDSYLAARPEGPLAEEARSGRVGALRKLGRDADADAAMQDLVTNHPHSLYAKPVVRSIP